MIDVDPEPAPRLLLVLRRDVGRRRRKIADVPDAALDDVIAAEVARDGRRLGRGLDDDQATDAVAVVVGRPRRAVTGAGGALRTRGHWGLLLVLDWCIGPESARLAHFGAPPSRAHGNGSAPRMSAQPCPGGSRGAVDTPRRRPPMGPMSDSRWPSGLRALLFGFLCSAPHVQQSRSAPHVQQSRSAPRVQQSKGRRKAESGAPLGVQQGEVRRRGSTTSRSALLHRRRRYDASRSPRRPR